MTTVPTVTVVIIIITAIFTYLGFQDRDFLEKYYFNVESILGRKEYHRLITSGFLHADIGHLLFNMVSFYSFAKNIEFIYGALYVYIIYSASLIAGSLFSLYIHKSHPDYSALGASGAVSGIIFASIFLLPGGHILIFFLPIPIPAYIYGILFILISIYGIKSGRGNIGHEAHLGGAVAGIAVTGLLSPVSIKNSLHLFIAIIVIVSCFIIYFILNPLMLPGKKIPLKPKINKFKEYRELLKIKKGRDKLNNDIQKILEKAAKTKDQGTDKTDDE